MAKWNIPDNRKKKKIKALAEALLAYVETDETPETEDSELGEIKRQGIAALELVGRL